MIDRVPEGLLGTQSLATFSWNWQLPRYITSVYPKAKKR